MVCSNFRHRAPHKDRSQLTLPRRERGSTKYGSGSDALPAVVRDFHKDRHHAPPAIVFVHRRPVGVRPERGTFLLRLPRQRPSLARRGAAGTPALPHGERL